MPGWGAAIAGVASLAGGLMSKPKQPKSYIPRRETLASERQRLQARDASMYGGPGTGSQQDLYRNPENWAEYGPEPFSPTNEFEDRAIRGVADYASNYGSQYQPWANTVANQVTNGGNSQQYSNAFQQLLPQMQTAFGQPATQITAGEVGGIDPQYLQGAMNAYLQPMMEQFNEQLLPGMQRADSAATGGQGSAGALKAAQRVQEQIGESANAYGQGLLYNASQSALDRMGTDYDRRLRADMATGDFGQQRLSSLVQAGGIGAGSGSDADRARYAFSTQMPDVLTQGMGGAQAYGLAGTMQRGLDDPRYQYAADRFNYYENQPYVMGNAWQEQLRNAAPPGGVPAQTNPVGVANPTGAAITSGLTAALANWPQARPTSGPSATEMMSNAQRYGGYGAGTYVNAPGQVDPTTLRWKP